MNCLKICIEFLLGIKIPHLYSNPHFSIFHSPSEADSESLSHFSWKSEKKTGFKFSAVKGGNSIWFSCNFARLVLGVRAFFSGKKLFLFCRESTWVFLIRKTRKKHYLLGWENSHIHPIRSISPSTVCGTLAKLLVRKSLLWKW